jgi:hypothetical protein
MFRRTETIKLGDFMSGEYKRKGKRKKVVKTENKALNVASVLGPVLIGSLPLFLYAGKPLGANAAAVTVMAQPEAIPAGIITDAAKEKIIHAFDPLVDLMVNLSLPIAGVMLTGGALMIMIGQKEAGYKLIFNAALGYVLVQMSPLFISLLAGVGGAL